MNRFLRIITIVIVLELLAWATSTTLRKVVISQSQVSNTTITSSTYSGTVDATVIGGVTPAAATFTTANATSFVGPLTGNASTASQFQNTPTQCSNSSLVVTGGIGVTGAPVGCGPAIRAGTITTSCTTAASSFSTCNSSGTWNSSFPNGNHVFISCASASSTTGRGVLLNASGTQTGFSITVSTMGSTAETLSNVDCTGVQF